MIGNDTSSQPGKTPEFINGITSYFKGVKSEWGKISWPERRQVVAETLFVIVIVFVFTVSVYLMDIIFKGLLGLIKQFQNRKIKVAYGKKRKINGRTTE